MAESYIATSAIKHGSKDGTMTTVAEGDKVTKSNFSDEEWEGLLAAGAVVTKGEYEEAQESKTPVAEEEPAGGGTT